MWTWTQLPTNCLNGVFNLCVAYVNPQQDSEQKQQTVPGEGTTGTRRSISHVGAASQSQSGPVAKNLIKFHAARVLAYIIIIIIMIIILI